MSAPAADAQKGPDPVLEVRGLSVGFRTSGGVVPAVQELSFDLRAGGILGLVGESGSGKTSAALALAGLHDPAVTEVTGSVRVAGVEVVGAPERTLRRLRGAAVAMVFQDSLTALHPLVPVGRQLAEAHRAHRDVSRRAAGTRAVELLDRVGVPEPHRRARELPHQLSGGMRQRALIAMALANDPVVLVADEPTTALDVTVQAQVLDLLTDVAAEQGTAVLLVSHDLGVVAERADKVLVMYAGRAVEQGPTRDVLESPGMPYTQALLACTPSLLDAPQDRLDAVPGRPPSLLRTPPGCPFHPRCRHVAQVPGDRCRSALPDLADRDGRVEAAGHVWRCHLDRPTPARADASERGDG